MHTCKLTIFHMTNVNSITGASLYVYNHTDSKRQVFNLATSVCCVNISREEARKALHKAHNDQTVVITREVYRS